MTIYCYPSKHRLISMITFFNLFIISSAFSMNFWNSWYWICKSEISSSFIFIWLINCSLHFYFWRCWRIRSLLREAFDGYPLGRKKKWLSCEKNDHQSLNIKLKFTGQEFEEKKTRYPFSKIFVVQRKNQKLKN